MNEDRVSLQGPPTYSVLGVRVNAVQIPDVIAQMESWIAQRGRCRFIAVTGMHGVTETRHDLNFKKILNSADLIVPDGMPLVWLGRRYGFTLPRRVYGPELMLRFCQETAPKGYRHFFYGGAPAIAEALAQKLTTQFPGLIAAGTHCPPYRELTSQEDDEVVAKIEASRADIVWIGLSTPKQERWMYQHRPRLSVPVLIGVGAAFDFHTGRVRHAPAWVGDSGLEWLFRLIHEPRRLWRRYLVYGSEFAAMALLEVLGLKQFD